MAELSQKGVNVKALLPVPTPKRSLQSTSSSPTTSGAITPASSDLTDGESSGILMGKRLTTLIGEVCFSDYNVYELPSEESCLDMSSGSNLEKEQSPETQVVVNTALVTHIEAEAHSLRSKLVSTKPSHFSLEFIAHSDSLVSLYTGFHSYDLLLAFYEFLGPSVNKLTYWGSNKYKWE